METTQNRRHAELITPLGPDVLLLRSMESSEQLSALFRFDLVLLSRNANIQYDDLLGQGVSIRVDTAHAGKRFYHGIVSEFGYDGQRGEFAAYRATVRPALWLLTRQTDFRVFQNESIPDIVRRLLGDAGITCESRLSGQYPAREYVVQFGESSFDFISRLLEQEGIYYYFTHAKDSHVMVLVEDISGHTAMPGYETVEYREGGSSARARPERLTDWGERKGVRPGRFTLRAFDFERPRADLEVRRKADFGHANAHYENYSYPGSYTQAEQGDQYVRVRLEEQAALRAQVTGSGDVRGLCPGYLFTLTRHPRADQNREYLAVGVHQYLENNDFSSSGESAVYTSSLVAIDAATPYRPPRLTTKPRVPGPQTAVVVGPPGEEIWVDKYGRVKCQFHWDREGKFNDSSSCWIRVSQNWAGKGWGAIHTPRIGHEVIVDFLNGDPDQPIITGRVYNGDNMPPYPLPANKEISGVMSNSTKGGGGANEFILDDTKGEEKIRIHAEHNMITEVEHNKFAAIGNNDREIVGGNKLVQVRGKSKPPKGMKTPGYQIQVDGDFRVFADNEAHWVVGGKGGCTDWHMDGKDWKLNVPGDVAIKADTNCHLDTSSTYLKSKDVIQANAPNFHVFSDSIKLVAGGSSIEITPGQINISSPLINIQGGMVKINS